MESISQDPQKPLKQLPVLPLIKITNIFSSFMKGFLAICLVATISVISFSAFSNHNSEWLGCSDCEQQTFIHTASGYFSGSHYYDETNISHLLLVSVAYGGAGFSYPLAAKLVMVLDGCIDRYASLYGFDQKIQSCMSEIGVPVTKELDFHQVDVRGDAYGLLAAHPLASLVSMHHLDYVQPIFPDLNRVESVKKLVNAYSADPGRDLQHSFCYDLRRNWSVSVSWGYTGDCKAVGNSVSDFCVMEDLE